MRRIIVGMLLALVAWLIGTQIAFWPAKWLGLVLGFVAGLALEDWQVTKSVVSQKWQQCWNHEFSWKGIGIYLLANLCVCSTIMAWLILSFDIYDITITNHFQFSFYFWVLISIVSTLVMSLSRTNPLYAERYNSEALTGIAFGWMSLCLMLNPVSVVIYWPLYGICQCLKRSPRFGQFLFYSLIELMAREKTLTFAICVTAGAGVGMLMGKTIVCGLTAAFLSGTLIVVSDKTRGFAQQKLQVLKQNA